MLAYTKGLLSSKTELIKTVTTATFDLSVGLPMQHEAQLFSVCSLFLHAGGTVDIHSVYYLYVLFSMKRLADLASSAGLVMHHNGYINPP